MSHRGSADAGSDARVDELRRHLRALGYLDAGVDRFVLGPARAQRSPALIALLASLRIGLVAALLLGPAAAIGVGARLPGFITGPRDALVVAVYSGILLGTAVTLAAVAAGMLLVAAGRMLAGRRARLLALATGAVVAAACLAYLTLWWRVANTGHDSSAPISAFALIVAVAISLLLGHAVAVMASAVVMARSPSDESGDEAAAALFSWRLSLGAGAVAFAGAAVLLLLTAPAESRGAPGRPALTVVPSGLRVRLIAIDGFDPVTFETLANGGELPGMSAAFAAGRATLAPQDTRDPARAWTTIATGYPPDVHGVHGLETRRVTGVQGSVPLAARAGAVRALQAAADLLRLTRPSLARGDDRRVKTFWEVAADTGLRTVVVNWWATWPAPEQGSATILSDRATLRLEVGGALDAEIAPAALYERLRAEWSAIRRAAAAQAAPLVQAAARGEIAEILRRSSELDALQLVLAGRVAGPAPDLLALYLPGLDIAQHTLFGEQTAPLAPSAVAARLDALREYYRFLDRLLADVLAPGADEIVFVITGPGRVAERGIGVLAVRGGPARAQVRVTAQAADVMPTLAFALGLPHSRELPGRPLLELFSAEHRARFPVREVASYGRPATISSPRSGQPLDEEMIERLRSLGYVR